MTRADRVDQILTQLAEELTDHGFHVYHGDTPRKSWLNIFSPDKTHQVYVQHNDLEWSWSISRDIKPNEKTGSSELLKKIYSDELNPGLMRAHLMKCWDAEKQIATLKRFAVYF